MTKDGFDSDRKDKVKELDERAKVFYREYWDVITIIDADDYKGKTYPDNPENLTAKHLLDYSGIDKIVNAGNPQQIITVGQRTRSPDSIGHDFSLRVDTGTKKDGEKTKFLNALNGLGSLPTVFGHGKYEIFANEKLFQHFHLIDARKLIISIRDGNLEPCDRKGNGDGTEAEYYRIEDIRDTGAILKSWGEGWK